MPPPSSTATETATSATATVQVNAQVMPEFPRPPVFEDKYKEREYLKGRLAAAFRIFGKYGFDEGVAGHITLRDPVDPTTFWVNPFGVAFSLINASDLIQVDHDGKVIDGGKVRLLNTAAYMIHAAVHEARPDVVCAAHSHSIYGRTFCALGKPLDITTQDACAFYNVGPFFFYFKIFLFFFVFFLSPTMVLFTLRYLLSVRQEITASRPTAYHGRKYKLTLVRFLGACFLF